MLYINLKECGQVEIRTHDPLTGSQILFRPMLAGPAETMMKRTHDLKLSRGHKQINLGIDFPPLVKY